jgi:hypothetical protein
MSNSKTSDVLGRNTIYSDPFWDDFRVSASNTKINPAQSKPDFNTFIDGTFTFLFDNTDIESVHFTIQLPHEYKLETNLYPHVHWAPTTTGSGTVRWALEYTMANINATFPNTTTIFINDDADGTAYKHQLISLPEIVGTGITSVSTMLVCRLYRDPGNDTYGADAAFLEFDLHYQIDRPGSREETSK